MQQDTLFAMQDVFAPMSDKEAALAIIAGIRKTPNVKRSDGGEESYFFQLTAALRYGYGEPFTTSQMALNKFLTEIMASKKLTQEAWKKYHLLRKGS